MRRLVSLDAEFVKLALDHIGDGLPERSVIEQIEPDLTLDGLRLLAARNPTPTFTRDKARLIESE